jgi:acyl carrier protein
MQTYEQIRQIAFEEVSKVSDAVVTDENASLESLGVDSAMLISLIFSLEERFGVSIPESYFQAENFADVSSISRTMSEIFASVPN